MTFFAACQHFFEMGGYDIYLWPAYGFTFLMLLLSLYFPLRQRRQLLKLLAKKYLK